MTTIRLGTASPATQATTPATITHLGAVAQRAAAQKIDILLLPEAFIGGYPRGTNFGSKIGSRTAGGRDEYLEYFEGAVDLGDTVGDSGAGGGDRWVNRQLPGGEDRGDGTREKLENIAKETGVFIVTGLVEKTGGTLYCAAVYVCPQKGMLGKRRKVMPTGTERLCWGQAGPASLKAVSTVIRGVRINLAAAICWENYMPLLRQTLYSQNINLYLAPTADQRDTWMSLMRTVGCEGRCFVVSSNMAVRDTAPGSSDTAVTAPVQRSNGARRNSVVDENGNEIVLCADKKKTPRRRNSVLDNDGNEIVLCADKPAPKANSSRRKSIINEDGNEIVLCAEDKEAPKTMAPAVSSTTTPTVSRGWACRGGSSIVSPLGEVLAGPQWEDDDGLIYSDVDFRDCTKGRLDFDAGGSYSRNDSFKFSVAGLELDPLPY